MAQVGEDTEVRVLLHHLAHQLGNSDPVVFPVSPLLLRVDLVQ